MQLNNLAVTGLSLRHLKAMLYVYNDRNVTKAAKRLNRTQTAVTLAIAELEQALDVPLFERASTGMIPTVYGDVLAHRVELAAAEFEMAAKEYKRLNKSEHLSGSISVFSMEISYKRLAALIALYDTREISAAAALRHVTKTAIYNSVRELEDLLELSLFERHPGGVTATSFCSTLVRHSKLAFSHIRHALDELASLDGVNSGRVCIGTLPYTRTILNPRAINRLLDEHPGLQVSTQEGTYAQLEVSLRNGDLDFIVGATRQDGSVKGLLTERLFDDRLAVIARADHPLTNVDKLKPENLSELRWVLPSRQTPARLLFNDFLRKHHLDQPVDFIETSSLTTLRGLLLESDRVALLSEHQVYYEKKYGLLSVLPIELEETYRPIGVTMRANSKPSPAAHLFLQQLRSVARELQDHNLNESGNNIV